MDEVIDEIMLVTGSRTLVTGSRIPPEVELDVGGGVGTVEESLVGPGGVCDVDVGGSRILVTGSKMEVTGSRIEVTGSKIEVTGSKMDVMGSKMPPSDVEDDTVGGVVGVVVTVPEGGVVTGSEVDGEVFEDEGGDVTGSESEVVVAEDVEVSVGSVGGTDIDVGGRAVVIPVGDEVGVESVGEEAGSEVTVLVTITSEVTVTSLALLEVALEVDVSVVEDESEESVPVLLDEGVGRGLTMSPKGEGRSTSMGKSRGMPIGLKPSPCK
jgi:hypothetical protein